MLQINASIVVHNSRTFCVYRTKNLYDYDSESYISELDIELDVIGDQRLTAENKNSAFEDVRLFSTGRDLLAFYTYFPLNDKGKWEWIYGVGFGIVDIKNGKIKNQQSLRTLSKRVHEKNWCPFMYENELYMITDFYPFVRIIHIGDIRNRLTFKEIYISKNQTINWNYGELRGGTPLLNNPDDPNGWLYGFAHSYLSHCNGFHRYYFYTAVRFNMYSKILEYHPTPLPYDDGDLEEEYLALWKYSNNMKLKVIFPIGIAHYNNGLIVSFGKDDVSSYTQIFSWEYIISLFLNNNP